MDDTHISSDDIAVASQPAADPSSAAPAPLTSTTPASTVPAEPSRTTEDSRGPLPYDRHEAILRTTRDGYETRLKSTAWAERLDRQQVEEALKLADLRARNPRQLYDELTPLVRTPTAPAPDLQTEDGRRLYSAEQAAALVRYELDRTLAEHDKSLEARIGPIEAAREQAATTERLQTQIDTASQWPGFMDHLDAVTAAVTAANAERRVLTLQDAYIQVVVPKLRETERRAILAEMDTTAAATSEPINPGRPPRANRVADKDKPLTQLIAEEYAARK